MKKFEQELKEMVPPSLSSTMEKQSKKEAVTKYEERKKRENVIIPPTCTGKYYSLVAKAIKPIFAVTLLLTLILG